MASEGIFPVKHHDWQSRLAAVIEARDAQAFAWGTNDCCIFAADCVLAMTGCDLAAAFRGTYSDALGAERLIAELGGVEQIADANCLHQIAPIAAALGDVGVVESDGRKLLAICGGAVWLAPGASGLVRFDRALRAWRAA